jgi:TPR repeat protein
MRRLIVLALSCASVLGADRSVPAISVETNRSSPVTDSYKLESDLIQAEQSCRKAAEQGDAESQGQLGHILLVRSRKPTTSIGERLFLWEEVLKWVALAANQGDKRGQADLSEVYFEGRIVHRDLVEACTWGSLAAQGPMTNSATVAGTHFRDAAIQKMTPQQIEESRRRVAAFSPRKLKPYQAPESSISWVRMIEIKGLGGTAAHRVVMINDQTFEEGEQREIKAGSKTVKIRCVRIGESFVVLTLEGLQGELELRMRTG